MTGHAPLPRAAALLAAVLSALAVLVGAPAGPARAQTAAPPLVVAEVTLTVTDLRPLAPRPGDDLVVLGTLGNEGDTPLRDVQVQVGVGARRDTRSALRVADGQTPYYAPVGTPTDLPDLEPGGQRPIDVRVPVDDLPLSLDGVYPLQVEVLGRRGDGVAEQLTAVQTYLPWFGTTEVDPLRVAWLWPLVDVPRQRPDGALADDELARALAAEGRLGRSLRASRAAEAGGCPAAVTTRKGARAPTCSPVRVTYAVDPDLLHTAREMTRPYQVRRRERTVPGTGQQAATEWLAALRAAVPSTDVLSLPFADPDVVALTRGTAPLAADVAAAQSYGVTVTREVLGEESLQTVAFPPPGQLTDTALAALTTGSTRAVVLEDHALIAPPDGATSTPGTRVELPPSSTSGPLTGLVVDRGLSDLLVPDQVSWQGSRIAEQRWLVETAMIAAELPARGRTLLVAPPRRGDLDQALLGGALVDTGAVPWMCPVQLADVVADRERCPGAAVRTEGTPPSRALAQPALDMPELEARDVADLAEVRASAGQLVDAVLQGGTEQAQSTRTRLQRGWLRPESSAWRDERRGGVRLTRLLDEDVSALRARLRVVTTPVTLTSANGRVSVAVVNELDQPVTVAVRLEAPAQARLSEAQTETLEVAARSIVPVEVQARTLTSGRFVVRTQLLDRDGQPFGDPEDLLVHSTRYGTAALGVTGLGAAVLLVAAGVRLVRRARGGSPTPGSPTPGPGAPAAAS